MGIVLTTRLRAEHVREEIHSAKRLVADSEDAGGLASKLDLVLGTLEFWLQPPGDDFQVRAAISEAEALLAEVRDGPAHGQDTRAETRDARKHERVPLSGATIRVQITEGAKLEQFYLRDISAGGMFLRATQILPVFSHLFIVLVMPDGTEIRICCRVVHVRLPQESNEASPPGMGVEFVGVTAEMKQQIASYIESLKQGN